MTFGGPGRSTQVLSLHIYKTAFTSQALGYASTIAVDVDVHHADTQHDL